MLAAFRNLSKSAVGTVIAVLFLLAILASFALADMSNLRSGTLGGGGGGALVDVGSEEVTERELSDRMRRALQDAQRQDPSATYATIAGQFGAALESLVDEKAVLSFAQDHGFFLSKRLVDGQIASLPQTRGLDGKFNEQAYAAFLQQQQMTDAQLRNMLQVALMQRLVVAPAAVEARIPVGVARSYADMLLEQREGQMTLVPAELFRSGLNPTDGDLQSFYAQNRQRYIVPEQRVLKIARATADTVAGVQPSDKEITDYYNSNRATYGGLETRVISQAVVQDKAAANGIAARARGGAAFAAAAAPAGFAAADVSLGAQNREQFAALAGETVAGAAFSAKSGAIIGPVRSDLGWHVIKIEDVRAASGRSLAEARGEISTLLSANKRKEALTDLITRVEDQIADGASLTEAAAAAKLQVMTTPAILSNGAARGDASYKLPAELAPALQAGFAMGAEDDPEVVTLPDDAGYALIGVDRVIEAAPAPLAEIRDRVRNDWIQRKALDRARAVATDIAGKVAKGMSMEEARAAAGVALPPVEPVTARRLQVTQANADAVTALRMMFSLAEGKSRLVADPQGRGFVIVKTNKITPGNALNSPGLISQTQAAFQQTASDELAGQFLAALKADQGVERDAEAIAAARQRIVGSGQ